MARTLREQFALATLLLLVPVSGVIVWAGRAAYNGEVLQLSEESSQLAAVVASGARRGATGNDSSLQSFLDALPLPQGGVVTVTDARGVVLARRADSSLDGEERMFGTTRVSGLGWTVHVGIPTSLAWQRTVPIYRRTVEISALATLLMLAFEAIFLRRWLRSLTHFQQSADRVGQGDLRPPPREPMPSREFEHVRDAFSGMVDNMREAREALARQIEELQALQQQIIRQERLAAIGTLLSGIAHELNNPLQAISGLADVIQRDRTVREDVRADLALIQKESRRASAIIRNLSRFGRQQGLTSTAVILSDVIMSVVELRQRRFQELGVVLEVDERALQRAHAVFAELQQVLLNFVINAEQAVMMQGVAERRITIRTRDLEGRVRVEVEDTGPGVPVEDEPKLFQPFFTTKPVGEGTGLGLSVSYGIIQSCAGTIGHERPPAGGARFFFELPAEAELPVETRPALRAASR